ASIADDADLAFAARDQDVAPSIAQRLELEIAAVQAGTGTGGTPIAQPALSIFRATQAVDPRALDAGIGVVLDVRSARCGAARRFVWQIDRRQRLEVPLRTRRSKHASTDQDLGTARLPRELVCERCGRLLDVEVELARFLRALD